MKPFSTDAVANYFVDRATEAGLPLSPMKLQKLIYFAHGWHLALQSEGTPLVSESVQAWEYGPVFPSMYHEFKDLGNKPIDRHAVHLDYDQGRIQITRPTISDELMKGFGENDSKLFLDRIWDVYSPHSAAALSNKTHEKGSPWWTVREKAKVEFNGTVPRGLNIPNELIKEYFLKSRRTAA